jgi:X-Pro dipeptidyl-peptidase
MRRMKLVLLAPVVCLVVLPPAPAGAQSFVDGLAQPVFNVTGSNLITHNVWVEIPNLDSDRDGINDRIRVQVRRPAVTETGVKLAVVLTASPYSGGTLPFPTYNINIPLYEPGKPGHDSYVAPDDPPPPFDPPPPYDGTEGSINNLAASAYQSYFLPRGFIFAYAQSLGTGHSTGCPTIGGVEESLAMKAVIDWFNGIGTAYNFAGDEVTAYWTTGATTMIGVSYDGTLPLAAASTGVEGLKSIVPIAGVSSYYDHRRSHGGIMMSNPTLGTDADTLFDNILTRRYPEVCAYMRDQIVQGMDRLTGDYNAWWHERNYVQYVDRFRAAVLISHGLNDLNTKPRMFARLWDGLTAHDVPRKIWLNTGGHGDGANSGSRQPAWRDMLNRFWSNTLYGVDNGALDGPKAAVQRAGSVWQDHDDWPVPESVATIVNLAPSGDNTIGGLQLESTREGKPVLETVVDNSAIDATVLAAAAQSPHRLIYQTPPLAAPVHISGIPSVALRMSFNAPAAIVSAMLIEYRANGTRAIITRGWADPQNRKSLSETFAVHPGSPYEITFELQPHDHVFAAGSRIGLMVLSTDRLFTLRPPPGAELTLDTTKSALILPVVGGAAAFAAATTPAVP